MTQAFNLSQLANRVNTSGQLDASTGLYNQTPVANGGTGKSTVTTGALLLGAGTSAMTELTGTTPNNIVFSSPTGWTSVPAGQASGSNFIATRYTSPASWDVDTKKANGLKAVKITVIGGGGNGGSVTGPGTGGAACGGGGGGGAAVSYFTAPAITPSPTGVPITAGTGANSFGSLISATGGVTAANVSPGGGAGAGGAAGSGAPGNILAVSGIAGVGAGPTLTSGSGGAGALIFGFVGGSPRIVVAGGGGAGFAAVATNYGGGGGGAIKASPNANSYAGGAGAPGVVIVEEFY